MKFLMIILFTIFAVVSFPVFAEKSICKTNPELFQCVPDSQKIQLNRDRIQSLSAFSNRNRQRIFSLERAQEELGGGVAAAMAMGSHQFDPGNSGLQGSVAIGGFDGYGGISLSIGGKPTENTFLNVSGARGSHNVSAVSASFTWGFK